MGISSVYGIIGKPQLPIYVASKHAVLGLTKAAALEYAKAGIRINAVAPGAIETEMMEQSIGNDKQLRQALVAMHPIGRAGKPEEIANADKANRTYTSSKYHVILEMTWLQAIEPLLILIIG